MIIFKELSPELANRCWTKFAPHHYDYGKEREKLANSSRKYLAVENGVVIGFCAVINGWIEKGKQKPYRSHKVATLPEQAHRWGDVADALAQFVHTCGHRYYCATPVALARYREGNSDWRKVSEWDGLSSWEYTGGTHEKSSVDAG